MPRTCDVWSWRVPERSCGIRLGPLVRQYPQVYNITYNTSSQYCFGLRTVENAPKACHKPKSGSTTLNIETDAIGEAHHLNSVADNFQNTNFLRLERIRFRPPRDVTVFKINLSRIPRLRRDKSRTPNKDPDLRWNGVVEIQARVEERQPSYPAPGPASTGRN